ncbi:hypothetical protein ACFPAF_06715 [Hymenobacter endophyticus]|nr:hypothetical protein [Hymenobacter endophyticus]
MRHLPMTELEVSFRAALHEARFSTAAVWLAQVVAAQAASGRSLPGGHEILFQRRCADLLSEQPAHTASILLRKAEQYVHDLYNGQSVPG